MYSQPIGDHILQILVVGSVRFDLGPALHGQPTKSNLNMLLSNQNHADDFMS